MDEYLRPRTLVEALDARRARPEAVPVAGGTDVLADVNFGRRQLSSILDLSGVEDLSVISAQDSAVHVGAAATCTTMTDRLSRLSPSLAAASRTVGSPLIRNRGTIGGNLATASPAGDCHPPLLACRATVELSSADSTRQVPAAQFFTGPKSSVLFPDELITGVSIPVIRGPQMFAKVGFRNAMVCAVCSLAMSLDPVAARVGIGIGAAGPVPIQAVDAESFLEGHLAASGSWESRHTLPDSVLDRFAQLVTAAAQPIDDVRSTASYRRGALKVLARRMLIWCWEEYRREDAREAS